jgi:hypothetical protein
MKELMSMQANKEIEKMQAQMEKENQIRQLEVEQRREIIKKRLETPGLDESERAKIMRELNDFEGNLKN